jgi:pimeloyl-ACP methyl ester carboxylesterase
LTFVVGPESDVNPLSSTTVPDASTWSFNLAIPTVSKITNEQFIGIYDGEIAYLGYDSRGNSAFSTLSRRNIFATKTGSIDDIAPNPKYPKLIAFSNSRGDHSFIGLYGEPDSGPANDPNVVWVGASVDFDYGMVWNQDGSKLAWVRTYDMDDIQGRYPFAKGDPFSVMVAEVAYTPATGMATVSNVRAVYTDWDFGVADDNLGFGIRALAWSGNEVIFPSEAFPKAGGYLHVGAVDITSLVVRDLTARTTTTLQGCESRDYSVSADGKYLYVAHNCDTRDSIGLAQVTIADPTQWVPLLVGTADKAGGLGDDAAGAIALSLGVFFLQSTFNNPLSVMFISNGGSQVVELTPPNTTRYPAFNNSGYVKPKLVNFNASDNKYLLSAQMFIPPTAVAKNVAILFTHGGSQRQMLPVFHFSPVYAQLYAVNQYLASQGYLVLSTNYRSGVAYGHDFRVCDECGYYGGKEYVDVLTSGKWLLSQPGIKKVGIHGLSYGGLNCLQALGRNSDVFAAGVASAPVLNWVATDAGSMKWQTFSDLDWGFRQLPEGPESDLAGPAWPAAAAANVNLAWQSSPVSAITNLKSPVLLIHGDNDEEVYFQESRGVVRALRRTLGPQKAAELVETLVFPDENHGSSFCVWL